jgi:transcriptional repressor NF-X1
MPESKRKFVHDVSQPVLCGNFCSEHQTLHLLSKLAAVYRIDSQMVDREPHRSVQLIRRIDTRTPTNLLSQTIVTTSTLGKLADLRAPARATLSVSAPAQTPAGSGTPKVNRGWNSVLAHPRPQTPPPPSHAPSNSLSARTGPSTPRSTTPSQLASSTSSWATPGASRSATPLPATSQPVAAVATAAPSSSEVVPDNWEDDEM